MTTDDVIEHWRKGSMNELRSAQLLFDGAQYSSSLFHCHLAVEKALKSLYMRHAKKEPRLTHDLLQLALELRDDWTADDKQFLADLTAYAVTARYDDPDWAEREATQENVRLWISNVTVFITALFDEA